MPLDTDPGPLAVQLGAIRRLGPAARFRLAAEMSEDLRRISIAGERRRHPDLTPAEARWAVLSRLWGAPLVAQVAERGRR